MRECRRQRAREPFAVAAVGCIRIGRLKIEVKAAAPSSTHRNSCRRYYSAAGTRSILCMYISVCAAAHIIHTCINVLYSVL